jgi:GntR family transcriptional regulator
MPREQAAGAVVVDRLRDRIVSGVYLGHWHPGARLPSIRELAESEQVDRKTVAAAYRRLESEGLVRVHARSGVYLRGGRAPDGGGPLDRLYRRWLETTYERASALGLDSRTILRLINAVAEVERQMLPVIECDDAQAETLASELRQRLGINAQPIVLGAGLESAVPAPFLITTPYHRAQLVTLLPDKNVVELTLSVDAIRELRARMNAGSAAIVAATPMVGQKIMRAVERGQLTEGPGSLRVVVAVTPTQVASETADCRVVLVWPGAPSWVRDCVNRRECIMPVHCLSEDSIARVRTAVLEAAIRRVHERRPEEVTTTSAAEPRPLLVAVDV